MKHIGMRSEFRYKYLLGGVIFGLAFPIISSLLQLRRLEMPVDFGNLIWLQQNEPLLWIIDLAPVFLALMAYLIGTKQDKLNYLNSDLKYRLDAQIEELAASNDRLRREIEQKKQAEEKLKGAVRKAEQASKAKTEFLSTMSHEIRTPLNAVIGMTGILMETKLSGQQVDFVRTIKVGGESLLSVINDILDYSKIEAGMLELEEQAFNTLDPIEDVADLLTGKIHQKKLEFLYELDEGVPAAISSDLTRLRQVLVNLVGNAIKFTEEGEIQVRVRHLGTEANKEILQFEVRDTGIGIPEEKLSKLFKSFSQVDASTTRKYGGTGLGLAICKKIVEAMGGKIWVTSEVGKGSSFFFTIHATKADVRKFELLDAITIFKGKKILLIDDNQTNLDILSRQCRNWGFEVKAFIDPKEALEFSRKKSFDLCITDMQMPEMDGVMLAEKMKEDHENCPPIILLSSIDQGILEDKRGLFDYVLNKPAKVEQLFNALARLLGWKASRAKSLPSSEAQKAEAILKEPAIRTLLAEDNPVNQKVARHMLRKLNIEADIAGNGLEAFELAKQFRYELILMDMQMPIMGGLESTRKILEHYKDNHNYAPTIIAMTANSSSDDKEICLQAGMVDFISKPVNLAKLREVIAQYSEPSMAR